MQTARIAIVGAGLSGLYAAYLLEQQGIKDYVLLEARDTLGGRIACAPASGQPATGAEKLDRVDLGPTWFWPGYQHQLARLVDDMVQLLGGRAIYMTSDIIQPWLDLNAARAHVANDPNNRTGDVVGTMLGQPPAFTNSSTFSPSAFAAARGQADRIA